VLANLQSLAPHAQVVSLFPESLTIKTRYVDHKTNHHFLRIDSDTRSDPLHIPTFTGLMATGGFDAVCFSDYGKGYLTTGNMGQMLTFCSEMSVPTFVDTKSLLGPWSEQATFVKINEVEEAAHTKAGVTPWAWCENLIVTKGGDGMVIYTGPDDWVQYHSHGTPTEVTDAAGCGDTVLAALTVKYLENGGDIKQAMDWANKAAAIAVSHRGVVAVKREEVGPLKEKVALIAGCFDGKDGTLHPGHLHILTEAAKLGRLIVCINRDSYLVRKGPGRPLSGESDRARALYATGLVHHVRVIGDSPIDEIMEIKPDYIVVGDDYTIDRVVGAEECKAWQGQVVIVPRIPGFSTTGLLL
jgi:D-beta-D-heptose 7-phosphate kinase / D-beta-D-heptose 1-phosphate adenosyltransferase